MRSRFVRLCGELTKVKTFADVGCDHGFVTEYAIKNLLCDHAYAVDVSQSALNNAKNRLREYENQGKCTFLLANGLDGVPADVDLVLIAGMGGEEMIGIFKRGFIPKSFVLQPMNYSEQLRRYLIGQGCSILRDYTFFDGRFYDVIVGRASGEQKSYGDGEYEFGWDNLHPLKKGDNADFCKRIKKLIALQDQYIRKSPSNAVFEQLRARKQYLEDILDGCGG